MERWVNEMSSQNENLCTSSCLMASSQVHDQLNFCNLLIENFLITLHCACIGISGLRMQLYPRPRQLGSLCWSFKLCSSHYFACCASLSQMSCRPEFQMGLSAFVLSLNSETGPLDFGLSFNTLKPSMK